MQAEFAVHQALFGYEGGHQLLRSSIALSVETTHFLAVATDMSGSAPPGGFDAAITGLPVPGTQFYALFCTWLAPEMPRPGCVWSHTLLIELADLASISELEALRSYLSRPTTGLYDAYATPFRFRPTAGALGSPGFERSNVTQLIRGLYEKPIGPVVVPARSSQDVEKLVFAVWSQQWPRLRRSFRFSTGSFADRGRQAVAFDLQVTPLESRYLWQKARLIELGDPDADAEPAWVAEATNDICDPRQTLLRNFLRDFGTDVVETRGAFAALVGTFIAFRATAPTNWGSVLALIADRFPTPQQSPRLKERATCVDLDEAAKAWGVFEYLYNESAGGPFARIQFNLERWATELWMQHRGEALALLASPPARGNEDRWRSTIEAFARAIEPADLERIALIQAALVKAFVRLRPELALDECVWRLPDRPQWQVVDALEQQSITPPLWRAIVLAMLRSGTTVGIADIAARAGEETFDALVEWVRLGATVSTLSGSWRDAVHPWAAARTEGGTSLQPLEFAVCIALLPRTVLGRIDAAREDVQRLALVAADALPSDLTLPVAFFLVTIALQAQGAAGGPLLASSVFAVHNALARAEEPPESWRLLQPHLPELRFWQDWGPLQEAETRGTSMVAQQSGRSSSVEVRSYNSRGSGPGQTFDPGAMKSAIGLEKHVLGH